MISDQYYVAKARHLFFVALYSFLINPTDESEVCLQKYYTQSFEVRDSFIENNSLDNLISILNSYYVTENQYLYIMVCLLAKKMYENHNVEITDWVKQLPNAGYLIELLEDSKAHTFIVLESGSYDSVDCQIAASALSELGKDVFLLTSSIECHVENDIDMKDTVFVSIDNAEKYTNLTVIRPIEVVKNGKSMGDNRDYIISHITENLASNNLATVLCSGDLFDKLDTRPSMKKKLQRLSYFKSDYLNRNMEFGWAGDYVSYISKIYDFDVQAEISKPAECDFSIVIPARNSAYSLRYTLQSCLNQRFKGKYEIVLSDNSTNGNTQVYDLYCELNDERIKYYKTPRDLALPKSFEFAFLKARGNFTFSIGSDDALLPWGLDSISKVLEQIPDDEILMWERGFYAWPGFNGGQQNQFVIPKNYQKNKVDCERISGEMMLAQILNNPNNMYGLPMLYINSGFRRSYFQTLLKETGRLWDGVCQDLYMGIVNISINKDFPIIRYPLTIAGMTNSSIGMLSNRAITDNDEMNEIHETRKNTDNIGGYAPSSLERLLPTYDTDRASLYRSVLRVVARGALPIDLFDMIDWKNIFTFIAEQLSIDDIQLDRKLNWLRYSASLINEDVAKYVNEQLYAKLIVPRVVVPVSEEKIIQKRYEEGFMHNGGLTLDASKFGVTNVYEAAKLFEDLTGL